jgi:SAM-dependent methyltransferase
LNDRTAQPSRVEPGSFRDRTARVFYIGDGVYRGLTESALEAWQWTSRCAFFERGMAAGAIIDTSFEPIADFAGSSLDPAWQGILRHRRVPFVSYPYEWSFGMLKAAAALHLDLLRSAIDESVTMKDGTPFNVQWIGCQPVFIDVATFVPWEPGQPWDGYRQFCRMFLYPLMLQAYKRIPFQPWLRGRLEGLLADEFRRLLSWRDVVRPGVLTHVIAQSAFERQFAVSSRDVRGELRHAGFDRRVLVALVDKLKRLVDTLSWSIRSSPWTEYATDNSYAAVAVTAKETFVRRALGAASRRLVWDLGCNTGQFAKLAASHAEYVVAIDADHESVERLYRDVSHGGQANILPLTMDLADPSPALGWRSRERGTLLERGTPDLVLCLALVHHLAITANIPIDDILDWLADCGGDLVIEFPTEADEMVQRLRLNKTQRYDDYCLPAFERALTARFEIRERLQLPSTTRYLYYATRRADHRRRSAPSDGLRA